MCGVAYVRVKKFKQSGFARISQLPRRLVSLNLQSWQITDSNDTTDRRQMIQAAYSCVCITHGRVDPFKST